MVFLDRIRLIRRNGYEQQSGVDQERVRHTGKKKIKKKYRIWWHHIKLLCTSKHIYDMYCTYTWYESSLTWEQSSKLLWTHRSCDLHRAQRKERTCAIEYLSQNSACQPLNQATHMRRMMSVYPSGEAALISIWPKALWLLLALFIRDWEDGQIGAISQQANAASTCEKMIRGESQQACWEMERRMWE